MNRLCAPAETVERILTEPVFMAGSAGSTFCIRSKKSEEFVAQNSCVVLLVPPFAEEMNRSRRFFAKLRQELIRAGAAEVVQPDLFGTGDSAGDFSDATWDIWMSDLCHLVSELRSQGYIHINTIGVRAGCLLIDEMTRKLDEPFTNIVFVQPESSGYDVVQHMLRVRVASKRFSGGETESTAELWRLLESSATVELNGYSLGGALAMTLKEKRLDPARLSAVSIGHWLELVDEMPRSNPVGVQNADADSTQDSDSKPAADSQEMSSAWSQYRISAKPFWQMQEHEPDDELVAYIARQALTST